MIQDRATFIQESNEVREDFCSIINALRWDTDLRTKAESLLIMYDQMIEHLKQESAI